MSSGRTWNSEVNRLRPKSRLASVALVLIQSCVARQDLPDCAGAVHAGDRLSQRERAVPHLLVRLPNRQAKTSVGKAGEDSRIPRRPALAGARRQGLWRSPAAFLGTTKPVRVCGTTQSTTRRYAPSATPSSPVLRPEPQSAKLTPCRSTSFIAMTAGPGARFSCVPPTGKARRARSVGRSV
jgi:hypothetical protein